MTSFERQNAPERQSAFLQWGLTPPRRRAYTSPAAGVPAVGFGSPESWRTSRPSAVFYRPLHGSPSFGRPCGVPSGTPVQARSSNLHGRPPVWKRGGGSKSLAWSIAMPRTKPAPQCATVIPFPRFRRPKSSLPVAGFTTPEFHAGFECAMSMVAELKRRGLLSSSMKGA